MRFPCVKLLTLSLLLALPTCKAQQRKNADDSGRRLALVIGNAAYAAGRLRNPVNDARAVQDALRRLGFDVEATMDANRKELARAIDKFTGRLRSGDVSLFYYSGHGVQMDGENYLIPIDFAGDDLTEVKYGAYAMSNIRNALDRSRVRLKILLFDACRDNPFRGMRSNTKGLAKMFVGHDTFIAFATAPGMTASDGLGSDHSPFTAAVLQAIGVPGLSLDEIFNRVNDAVDRTSKGAQVPWHVSTVTETFYFAPSGSVTAGQPAGSPSPPRSSRILPNGKNGKKALNAYDEGKHLFDDNKFEEAMVKFTDSIRWNPNVATAFKYRAETELALGHHDRAIEDFRTSIALDPKNADLVTELGNAYLGGGKYDDSIEAFTSALKINPNLALAYSGLACVYDLLGQYKRAIDADTQALQLDPTMEIAYMNRAGVYLKLEQYEPALEDISKGISLASGQSDPVMGSYALFVSYVTRATLYSQVDRQSQAIEDLNQALRIKPNAGVIYVARGEIYKNTGNCKAAIPDLKKALALGDSPSGMEYPIDYLTAAMPILARKMSILHKIAAYGDLGECFATLGQLDEALSNSNEAIRIVPDENTYTSRAWVYEKFGKHREAIQDYDRALQLNPNHERAYLNRGLAYQNAGNCIRAMDNYNEAILLNPNNPWSFVNRSACRHNLGDHRAAINDADIAIRLKSTLPEAFHNRGAAHADLKEYGLAISDYNVAIRLKPDFGLAFRNRANAKAASGDSKGAQEDFKRARDLGYTE